MAEYLIERGIPQERVTVIHNWVDETAITPVAPGNNRLREVWGLTQKFVVGYSGNMGRAHDFDTILNAAEELKEDKNIAFLFIGNGSQRAFVEGEAIRRGLAQFLFKPYQARATLAESLGAADVHLVSLRPELERFVVPSKFYGCAAAGRSVIFVGDPNGGIGELVGIGNCGTVVRPKESLELAKTIRMLRDNPDVGHQWGINARRLVEQTFSRKRAMALWVKVLSSGTQPRSAEGVP
jgi:glycosyltransferase involved in cell wall biosynthesis